MSAATGGEQVEQKIVIADLRCVHCDRPGIVCLAVTTAPDGTPDAWCSLRCFYEHRVPRRVFS